MKGVSKTYDFIFPFHFILTVVFPLHKLFIQKELRKLWKRKGEP